MTPELFAQRCKHLGLVNATGIAATMGVNTSSASRWLSGATPIPDFALKILEYLEAALEAREKAIFWQRRCQTFELGLEQFRKLMDIASIPA